MAAIIIPSRWGQIKPPPATRIDWDHSLAQGLRACYLFESAIPTNLVYDHKLGTLSGSLVYDSESAVYLGASTGYARGPYAPWMDGWGGEFSVLADIATFGTQPDSGFGTMLVKERPSGQWPYAFYLRTSGLRLRLNTDTDDSSANLWDSGVALPTGSFVQGGYTWRTGGKPTCFVQGVEQTLVADGGTLSGNLKATTSGELAIGTVPGLNLRLNARLRWLYLWSRALSRDQLQWLTAEPYAFMVPPAPYKKYFIQSAGGTNVTVNTDTNVINSSAITPETKFDFVVLVDENIINSTPNTPTVVTDTGVLVNVSSLILQTILNDPVIVADQTVTIPLSPVILTLVGNDPYVIIPGATAGVLSRVYIVLALR